MKAAEAKTAELKFEDVDSSNIAQRAYDKSRQVIVVRFHNGNQYEYPNCDSTVWLGFRKAKSAGSFLHSVLNKKAYTRIDDWK